MSRCTVARPQPISFAIFCIVRPRRYRSIIRVYDCVILFADGAAFLYLCKALSDDRLWWWGAAGYVVFVPSVCLHGLCLLVHLLFVC